MNNGVGYARPAARPNPVVLGTDGIGADMLEEFRLAYVAHRADDVDASPDTAWSWLDNGYRFFPEAARRPRARGPTTTPTRRGTSRSRPGCGSSTSSRDDGEVLVAGGRPTRVDPDEVRAHAAEQADRLFARL